MKKRNCNCFCGRVMIFVSNFKKANRKEDLKTYHSCKNTFKITYIISPYNLTNYHHSHFSRLLEIAYDFPLIKKDNPFISFVLYKQTF